MLLPALSGRSSHSVLIKVSVCAVVLGMGMFPSSLSYFYAVTYWSFSIYIFRYLFYEDRKIVERISGEFPSVFLNYLYGESLWILASVKLSDFFSRN